jgi:hypothetical protein
MSPTGSSKILHVCLIFTVIVWWIRRQPWRIILCSPKEEANAKMNSKTYLTRDDLDRMGLEKGGFQIGYLQFSEPRRIAWVDSSKNSQQTTNIKMWVSFFNDRSWLLCLGGKNFNRYWIMSIMVKLILVQLTLIIPKQQGLQGYDITQSIDDRYSCREKV